MEHDDVCRTQDKELVELKTEHRAFRADLDSAVKRWQRTVDDIHAQNVRLERIEGKVDHIQSKVEDIEQALVALKDVVSKLTPKEDHLLLRGIVFAVIGAFGLGLIGAAVAFIVSGGLTR